MTEKINDKIVFSLLEVTQSIQKTLSDRYTSSFWVKSEMNKLNYYSQSGHCYPELVEKREEKIIAQIKSNLWRDDYNRINENFKKVLNETLKDGIKILFLAKVSFDPVYGLSLRIIDIDPSYSLGEIEREKNETIEKLKNEGIFNNNKIHKLSLLPKRIAIISVNSSKGYADFTKIIDGNPWKYKFFHFLFPALLQGEKATESITFQLQRIKKVIEHIDMVAIIRGGGGDVGLSCYNNYQLSKAVALFPIPAMTGIGHATNETVVEMVAYQNSITPTALGEFLLQKFHNFSVPVKNAEDKIIDKSKRIIKESKITFQNNVKYFRSVTKNMILNSHNEVSSNSRKLFYQANYFVKSERGLHNALIASTRRNALYFCSNKRTEIKQYVRNFKKDITAILKHSDFVIGQNLVYLKKSTNSIIDSNNQNLTKKGSDLNNVLRLAFKSGMSDLLNTERSIRMMDPLNVLNRGYSITSLNGKLVRTIEDVKVGDQIKTILYSGTISSTVKSTENKNDL